MTAPVKPKKPFTMVLRSLWQSERFTGLPNDQARYLFLYFLTCKHQTASGCFQLPDAYALSDLEMAGSCWTKEEYGHSRDALVQSGLIHFDRQTSEILINGWYRANPPTNAAWITGARRQCAAIESETLRQLALKALSECSDEIEAGHGRFPRSVPQR